MSSIHLNEFGPQLVTRYMFDLSDLICVINKLLRSRIAYQVSTLPVPFQLSYINNTLNVCACENVHNFRYTEFK